LVSELEAKRLVHTSIASRTDQALLLLAVGDVDPKGLSEIRDIAVRIGIRGAQRWNLSDTLRKSKLAIRVPDGWELTSDGREYVGRLSGAAKIAKATSSELRDVIARLTNPTAAEFLSEAADCVEDRHLRAAVVLSWTGAVAILQDYVVTNKLADFNNEAARRDAKWRPAKTADDMGRMKEADFLNVLVGISVIGKNVKQELEKCLDLRNGAGHPNSLKFGENRVAAHVEILALNVFAVFT
jgi:hypothetical protein